MPGSTLELASKTSSYSIFAAILDYGVIPLVCSLNSFPQSKMAPDIENVMCGTMGYHRMFLGGMKQATTLEVMGVSGRWNMENSIKD